MNSKEGDQEVAVNCIWGRADGPALCEWPSGKREMYPGETQKPKKVNQKQWQAMITRHYRLVPFPLPLLK